MQRGSCDIDPSSGRHRVYRAVRLFTVSRGLYLPEDDPDDGDDPHSGVPVQRKGGPKGRVAAAEVEEPDDF